MDIVLLVERKILSVAEKILAYLEGNCDYRTFEAELKKELDTLGCEILKEVLVLQRKFILGISYKLLYACIKGAKRLFTSILIQGKEPTVYA